MPSRLPLWSPRRDSSRFQSVLAGHGLSGGLVRDKLSTLQVNVGKRCNQACHHCHVDAGPKRTETMSRATAERLVGLVDGCGSVDTIDITGGAPELNPNFRWLVEQMRGRDKHVIDRCNLTVLFEEGMDDLADFLAAQEVEVTASLPCYGRDNVDKQRGKGVFGTSIEALERLNDLGYGRSGSGLRLNLVYNPVGAFLPPPQPSLEEQYRDHLRRDFGIEFHQLFTITNMPISRFAHSLERDGEYEAYMSLLVNHFNPATVEHLMCRSLVSVGYDGQLYDCDFNQMLELPLSGRPTNIFEIDSLHVLEGRAIATAEHCFGCTAGAGSSCGGTLQ